MEDDLGVPCRFVPFLSVLVFSGFEKRLVNRIERLTTGYIETKLLLETGQ
jgi:hypothetical protein